MEIRPILATLRKHKLTAILLTLQVAFTCAIVCNVAFMITHRVQRISMPTGIAENQLSVIRAEGIQQNANPQAQHATDLAALRAIPGVESVVATNGSLPLSQSSSFYGVCPTKKALEEAMQAQSLGAACVQPGVYGGSPGLVATLGLDLIEGRDFRSDEFVKDGQPPVAIISQALAERLYPGESPLGKELYTGGPNPIRVIGVVKTLLAARLRMPGTDYYTMIYPQLPSDTYTYYVMRSVPQDRDRVLKAAHDALLRVDPNRLVENTGETYTQIRAEYFQRDTTMIGLLLASALGLLFVTALGITGLANFWVGQRTRSIGIRRAIGATRGDILRYFQTENFLIVTFGVLLGVLLAVGLNLLLMKHYELPRLPLWYLPVGAVVLWLLGQLSVLAPALRASNVPPVVATRSV
ncbi:MAG: ABC transporter, permease protein [Rhodanobacteraceae bacterium]|jgi:putative ABC transport system permease protein|nr:MAG: ABC transporter, permease protein [Rhodanobacteraceae bacterium]